MKKAFTLIELLTVMAITAVLLTLIVLPVFQSFQFLRTAQAFGDAQDKARLLTDRIAREVGNAISVRDAASTTALIPNLDANRNPNGTFKEVELPYTKLDLIPPAQGTPESDAAGDPVFRDPITGKIDPTLKRPKGDININGVPGATVVRYWVGLNDSTKAYNEPYTGILMVRNGDRDNLFVLRRAEVQPFIYRDRKDGAANSRAWRPNLAFFRSDDDRGDGGDFDTRVIDLDDPKFFLADGQYLRESDNTRQPDAQKNARVANWAKASVIQTEISRYDMIRPVVAGSPPKVVLGADGTPSVVPLVQFRPTRVGSAPAAGTAAARPGLAIEGFDRIGPDTYKTERGLWTDAFVRYYPGGFAPGGAMEVASVNAYGAVNISNGGTDEGGLDGTAASPNNYELFSAQTYERYLARGQAYPFTAACLEAARLDTTPGHPGVEWQTKLEMRQIFTPFRILTSTGKILTSFPIEEVGTTAVAGNLPNLPVVQIQSPPQSPTQAGTGDAAAPISPTQTGYDPNKAFNRLWNAFPDLQGSLQRFIDLRFVPNADGTPSPLCPVYGASYPTFSGNTSFTGFVNAVNLSTVNRVRIVPGSDEVYGPDQNPGRAYGSGPVRYTRVTGNPGPNQYRLVYADLPEPLDPTANTVTAAGYGTLLGLDATIMGSGGGFDPAAYNPQNVVSAAIQARFKAGYLQLCSDPNVPLPSGPITIRYRFQFNGPADTFAVDLDTREVMQILLTIKNYPQSSAPNAQTVTLKSTATLRNALR